jgi:hypothetical protein
VGYTPQERLVYDRGMSIFEKNLGEILTGTLTRTCVRCQAQAPDTQTEYTLIGAKHAWRCNKAKRPDGTNVLEWYCPRCWKKAAAAAKNTPPDKP